MFANAVTLNISLISYYFQTYITKYNLKIFEKIRVYRDIATWVSYIICINICEIL